MRKAGFLTICCVALAATAAPAGAATTRAEYASEVNSICVQANKDLNEQLGKLGGGGKLEDADFEDMTKGERRKFMNRFGRVFTRVLLKVTRASGRTITALAAVPPAPGDEALVTNWLVSMKKGQRYGKRSNRLGVRFFKSFFEILVVLVEELEDPDAINQKPTKAQLRQGHRFVRIANALDKHTRRILDELSRSAELGSQLGATACIEESDPNEPGAKLVESLSRMAEPYVRAAQRLAKGN